MRQVKEEVIPFESGDGFVCNLVHIQGSEQPEKGPVIVVHGAGVRANIFRAPVQTTFVDFLVDRGYDVWLENWRASIDLPPNQWTLDQAALYDHPKAVETVVAQTGAESVKAVIHCQGSTSFMMSAVAGLVPQVTTIVSNAVSLHPVVPKRSKVKLKLSVPIVKRMTPYLNPQWGLAAEGFTPRLISAFVSLTHHECDNAVCKQVSFTYGSGFPTLWSHANLNDETHEWVKQEFAQVPLTFFEQITTCVSEGRLISVENLPGLPHDFVDVEPQTDARIAFFAGADNVCFLPESQERTFDHFSSLRPDYHSLHVLAGYGHLDVFMGRNAHRDVFPLIVDELEK